MIYNSEKHQIILDLAKCGLCDDGMARTKRLRCGTCHGSGKGIRGGKGGCKRCHGTGNSWAPNVDPALRCEYCKGTGEIKETFTSWIPREMMPAILEKIEIKVVRQNRDNTWNELYLGSNSIVSCTDYGAMNEAGDAAAVAQAHDSLKSVQLSKLVALRDQNVATLVNAVAIVITRNGWSLRKTNKIPSEIQPTARQSAELGQSVWANGGHGTLAAAKECF